MRWLMVILLLAGLVWVVALFKRRSRTVIAPDDLEMQAPEMAQDAPLVIHSTANPRSD